MEAPPLSTAPPPPTTPTAADSIDSSPHSRRTDSWDVDPPPPKLRLMCSYGGHIVPRPHDKSLCYIGGETRIIVIDRHTPLSDLAHRLSKTLLHNQSFALKYQLPNEDLDSLISVTTDEDLENMVEEYDRLNNNNNNGVKPGGRLRLFLFPKTASNIEQLLAENASIKSEEWFLDALNGKAARNLSASDRGFSESSSVNCLLGLDDDLGGKAGVVGKDAETTQIEGSKIAGNGNGNGNGIGNVNGGNNQDVHSIPDSPMLETNSSFGSTSSSPSVANLPPIRVHVVEDGHKLGIEDQFQQMNVVGAAGNVHMGKQEEVVGGYLAPVIVSGLPVVVGGSGEYANRVFSEDERSDHGGYRKAQLVQQQVQAQLQPQQHQQFHQRQTSAFDLPSPDSVSSERSEGSITNPLSRQRQAMYQEPIIQIQSGNTRVNTAAPNQTSGDQNNPKSQMQPQTQLQESGYVVSGQYDQNHPQIHHPQQFVHAGTQYIPAGAVPMSPYYHFYPSQQQNHPHQPVLDQQQYPVYYMPARQTQQAYMQPTTPSSHPQTPPSYNNQAVNATSKPEMATGMYRTAAGAATPQLVQVPQGQQYVGYTQIHHPSQSMAPPSSQANSAAYPYEFVDPNTHAQMYYTRPLPPQLAAQYQTMTSAAPVVVDASAQQLPTENIKQQQQVRTLQP